MKYRVTASEHFSRELKRLAKKHLSLKQDVKELGEVLSENPTQGTCIGRDCYKIRLAIKSKGKGKLGGARVITCVVALSESVTLLSIYDKAERATISDEELKQMLKAADLL
jgi:mRNA-degrading endonuclease RelE of RelBE toxin-antitoxin system